MAPRMPGIDRLVALALPLALAACGAQQVAEAPPIASIPAPLPENIPLLPPPPPPPTLVNQSKGEDLWHLRSGLNVAVLLCQGPDNVAMVANYNSVLNAHRALLSAAAQTEVDHFKVKGGRWQDAYDDHMTKVYNAYSGTLTRDAFCSKAKDILVHASASTTTADAFNDQATVMLWELNKAAGLPDPDGALARAAAGAPSGTTSLAPNSLPPAPPATRTAGPTALTSR